MKSIEFSIDPGRLRPCPWRLIPAPRGTKGAIFDAENEWLGEVQCKSRDDLLELGRLIEAVTWAISETPAKPAEICGGKTWLRRLLRGGPRG